MPIAKVLVQDAMYFWPGDVVDGETLTEARWVRGGVITMDAERATTETANGYCRLLEIDGEPAHFGGCCSAGPAA